MECIYGPSGFWGFTDIPEHAAPPDYADPYDPCMNYTGMVPVQRGAGDLNGVGANFFASYQDDGGGGRGGNMAADSDYGKEVVPHRKRC